MRGMEHTPLAIPINDRSLLAAVGRCHVVPDAHGRLGTIQCILSCPYR